jgi:hypothetical protein
MKSAVDTPATLSPTPLGEGVSITETETETGSTNGPGATGDNDIHKAAGPR